jgi:hypothetical protein
VEKMMKKFQRNKGSLLVVTMTFLFVLVTFALALLSYEFMSKRIVLSSQKFRQRNQNALIIKNRVKKDMLQGKTPDRKALLDGLTGVSEFEMSIVKNSFPNNAGRDYDNIPEVGYFSKNVERKDGKPVVFPWHTLLSFNMQEDIGVGQNKTQYNIIVDEFFPYAAYAPGGSVNLREAKSWHNPLLDKKESGQEFVEKFEGYLSAKIYAQDKISSDDKKISIPFGKAYSVNGPIFINTKDGGIGYSRIGTSRNHDKSNSKSIPSELKKQINDAFDKIATGSLDKTRLFIGKGFKAEYLFNPEQFASGGWISLFSIEQAMNFPFPTIPTFSSWGVFHTLMLHAPLPPDNKNWMKDMTLASSDSHIKSADNKNIGLYDILNDLKIKQPPIPGQPVRYTQEDLKTGINLLKEMKETYTKSLEFTGLRQGTLFDTVVSKLNELQLKRDQEIQVNMRKGCGVRTCPLCKHLYDQTNEAKDLKTLMEKYLEYKNFAKLNYDIDECKKFLEACLKDYTEAKKLEAKAEVTARSSKSKDIPQSRDEEKLINDAWISGAPLNSLWDKVKEATRTISLHLLKLEFEKIPPAVRDLFIEDVRLVHFSQSSKDENSSNFFKAESNGFKIVSTMTVPEGRTLKLDCKVTIEGDLWIQDGASLYVTDDLIVRSPFSTSGSSQLAGITKKKSTSSTDNNNNFKPSGRIFMGEGANLLVGGNLTCEGYPDTSSIILKSPLGKVNHITSSIISKKTIHIPHGIMSGVTIDEIARYKNNGNYADTYSSFMSQAPTVAKVAGPFHSRKCYFAKNPLCIRYAQIGPVPVPIPVGTKVVNANITIFNILTKLYAFELNALLGEYLFTQSDWWAFGEGVVPVISKLNAHSAISYERINMNLISGTLMTASNAFIQTMSQDIFSAIVTDVINALTKKIIRFIAEALIPGGELLSFVLEGVGAYSFIENTIMTGWLGLDNIPTQLKAVLDDNFQNHLIPFKANVHSTLTTFNQNNLEFSEVPGILIYAEDSGNTGTGITLGGKMSTGMIISRTSLRATAENVVGCLMSLEGDINAPNTRLMYFPYFTRASLYNPVKFQGNAVDQYYNNLKISNPKNNKSTSAPINIGVNSYNIFLENMR